VTGLYADVLGRAPEPGGLDGWQQAVQGGQFYAEYLGRAGSPAEVAGWVGALQAGGLTPDQVAQAFLASDEFYSRAGAAT
jgi:hypothetical protein